MRGRARSWALVFSVVSALSACVAAQAQAPLCEPLPAVRPWGHVLSQNYPPAIDAVGDELNTSLVVRQRDFWAPVWTPNLCQVNGKLTLLVCKVTGGPCGEGGTCVAVGTCSDSGKTCGANSDCNSGATCMPMNTWGWQCEHLRLYGSPKDPAKPIDPANPHDANLRWGFPGPILRARATTLMDPTRPPGPTNPTVREGSRIKIKLYNYLQPQSYADAMACNPATFRTCNNNQLYCTDNTGTATSSTCTQPSDCPTGPNPPYACLPVNCTSDGGCPTGTTCGAPQMVPQEHPNCFHGDSVTNLHLHGTHVSPQPHQDFVLLSLFPFGSTGVPTGNPDYAVGSYQINVNPLPWNQAPGTHWYHPHKHGATSIQVQSGMGGGLIIKGAFDDWLERLYHGQLIDREMAVQQISDANIFLTRVALPTFPPTPLVNGYATPVIKMQPGEIQRFRFVSATTQAPAVIAFEARISDVRQIAQDGVQFAWQNFDRQPLSSQGLYNSFQLTPGSRADFLVKAPNQPGSYAVSATVFIPEAARRMGKGLKRKPIVQRAPPMEVPADAPPVDADGNPLLFTIEVAGRPKPMSFPVTEKTDPACKTSPKPARCWPDTPYYLLDLAAPKTPPVSLTFAINGNAAAQPNSFTINGTQYNPDCAAVTVERGETQDWQINNDFGVNNSSTAAHPFHIHINPFQVMSIGTTAYSPPFFWQDSLALPVPGTGQPSNIVIRQRFDDYTGAYVLHCHILGHEDRGMMWNVQTVCPGKQSFGQTQHAGGPDNCAALSPALPACPPAKASN
jgi:FtsP/CotA-like multicopper oxidase with cupredoxin domain